MLSIFSCARFWAHVPALARGQENLRPLVCAGPSWGQVSVTAAALAGQRAHPVSVCNTCARRWGESSDAFRQCLRPQGEFRLSPASPAGALRFANEYSSVRPGVFCAEIRSN